MKEYIEREAVIDALNRLCDRVCQYSKVQRMVMCGACPLGDAFTVIEDDIPAADVVEEENVLKFYYVQSIDEYWIGRRIDNFYYAEYDTSCGQWVWSHSRYLPWGQHVVAPGTLWKEHTYTSEPEEIPFNEWLQGFIKKYVIVDKMDGGVNDGKVD